LVLDYLVLAKDKATHCVSFAQPCFTFMYTIIAFFVVSSCLKVR